jgi:hypothetical protein
MRHLRVDDSSNVLSVAYDPDKQTLDVEFAAGSAYRYRNVQPHQFGELAGSPSVGKWVSGTLVKNKAAYPFTKLDAATPPPETRLARMQVALEMIGSLDAPGQMTPKEMVTAIDRARILAQEALK